MRFRFVLRPMSTAALLIASLAITAHAQGTRPDPFRDEQVRKFLMLALDNITRALCEKNWPCAAATAEEKAKPPITIAEARLAMRRGTLSAMAGQGGLDWRSRNFSPMMAYFRQSLKKSERQMALIGLVHGIMQGIVERGPQKDCPAKTRDAVDKQLTFRP